MSDFDKQFEKAMAAAGSAAAAAEKDFTIRFYTREGGSPLRAGTVLELDDSRNITYQPVMHVFSTGIEARRLVEAVFRSKWGRHAHSASLWSGKISKKGTEGIPPRTTYFNPAAA